MKKTITLLMAFSFTTLFASGVQNLTQTEKYKTLTTQYNLAIRYKNTTEDQENLANAFKLFHKSALKGYIPSQYELGLMFHYGNGVRQNAELARLWLTRAAKKGHPQAQSILYRFYSAKQPDIMNFRTDR